MTIDSQITNIIQAASSIIVAITTIVYTYYSRQLLREMHFSRLATQLPHVSVRLRRSNGSKDNYTVLEVLNDGGSPAYDVTFLTPPGLNLRDSETGTAVSFLEQGISYLAAGEIIHGSVAIDIEPLTPSDAVIAVKYRSVSRRSYSGEYRLDVERYSRQSTGADILLKSDIPN